LAYEAEEFIGGLKVKLTTGIYLFDPSHKSFPVRVRGFGQANDKRLSHEEAYRPRSGDV